MARVTVEDCILKVPNRFELVLLASQRARELASGEEETLDRDNDKNPVVALREIAEETINIEDLRNKMIFGLQKLVEIDEPEDDTPTILAAAEKEWADVVTDSSPTSVVGDMAAADAASIQSDGKEDELTAGGEQLDTAGATDQAAPPAEDESTD